MTQAIFSVATNWAPPLVLSQEESRIWRQFTVEKNCAICFPQSDEMLGILPIVVWVRLTGLRCPCGSNEFRLHSVSVRAVEAFRGYRVGSYVWGCDNTGYFVD